MSDRRRVAITTDPSVDGPARVTSLDALQELLDEDLWEYGPEPEGVVVEIGAGALDNLPDGWTVEAVGEESSTF